MARTRLYSIEVKDAKSNTVVVSATVDWTSDDKHIAVAQIFRLPGVGESKSNAHRLSHRRAAKRTAVIAAKQQPKRRR
jgi:imidazoleglycerol phosphate synthase glutamine amidotransferase subunit HisH